MADSRFNPRGSSILIVDDVPANLGVLIPILENVGYQVQVATSGEKGLEIAARSLPDLILLDVMMPGIDGFETCRRLKSEETTRDIPVIFLTALDEMSNVEEGFEAGGVDYVRKPFEKEEVLVRIQTQLERGWLDRKLAEKNQELKTLNAHLQETVEARTREVEAKVRALEERGFEMYYQPIVDARAGKLHSLEALIRWPSGRQDQPSPADFIPVAEESGLILPVGGWVLESVCEQVAYWEIPVAVNN